MADQPHFFIDDTFNHIADNRSLREKKNIYILNTIMIILSGRVIL